MQIDALRSPLQLPTFTPPRCEDDERVTYARPSPGRLCVKCGQEVTPEPIGFMGKTFCPKCLGIVTKMEALHALFCDRPEPCKCGGDNV